MQKLKEDFHAAFDVFSLCVKLNELGVKDEKGKNIHSQILRSVMNRMNNMVADLKRIVTNRQREISRMITPQVQVCVVYMSHVTRKLVFGVCDQLRLKPAGSADETG